MQRTKPPFRADHVGSLLRTAALKEAREKRARGEITAGGAEAGRRPRDRRHHPQAGGGRASCRHRRRVSPRLLELRFSRTARRRRVLRRRAQDQVHQRRPAAAADAAARHRQARRLQAAPDDRGFQVPEGAHQADRQGDHPVAVLAAFPLRPRRRCRNRSIRRWTTSIATSASPIARRCAPSPTPAAAICSSTRSISRICAIRRCATHVTARGEDPETLPQHLCRYDQCRDRRYPGRYDDHHASVPRQFPLELRRQRRLRAGRRNAVQRNQCARLLHGIRQRPRRRLRAAALRAEGQDGGARPRHQQDRKARKPRRDQAPDRAGGEIRRRSTSFACRRNAASPRPRKATCCPRTSNGRSCA